MTNDHARYVIIQVVGRRNTGRQLTVRYFVDRHMDVERGFQFRLRVPTISEDDQFARGVQVLEVQSPSIRVRLRQDRDLPLRIASVSQGVLSTRSAVRVQ